MLQIHRSDWMKPCWKGCQPSGSFHNLRSGLPVGYGRLGQRPAVASMKVEGSEALFAWLFASAVTLHNAQMVRKLVTSF
jgi:hypothetical protein